MYVCIRRFIFSLMRLIESSGWFSITFYERSSSWFSITFSRRSSSVGTSQGKRWEIGLVTIISTNLFPLVPTFCCPTLTSADQISPSEEMFSATIWPNFHCLRFQTSSFITNTTPTCGLALPVCFGKLNFSLHSSSVVDTRWPIRSKIVSSFLSSSYIYV